jgi:hypothetical protein
LPIKEGGTYRFGNGPVNILDSAPYSHYFVPEPPYLQ